MGTEDIDRMGTGDTGTADTRTHTARMQITRPGLRATIVAAITRWLIGTSARTTGTMPAITPRGPVTMLIIGMVGDTTMAGVTTTTGLTTTVGDGAVGIGTAVALTWSVRAS
jgi:hypothetical protein